MVGEAATIIESKINAIERLIGLFRFERMVYLALTTTSVLILLTCALVLIVREEQAHWEVIVGLFGSSGLMGVTLSRLLRMWDQAFTLLIDKSTEDG